MEGDEGIKIRAPSVDGLVGGEQDEDPHDARRKADEVEQLDQDDQRDTQKLEGIAQLIRPLREICDRHERHINDDLGDQPADIHGKVAKDQSSHHRQRVRKHIGGIHRRHAQTVDHEFNQNKLNENRDLSRGLGQNKLQPRWRDLGVFGEQKPDGNEKKRCPKDDMPHDADIGARHRRKIIVVGLLHEIEDGGRQDHDLG